ncbi:hypothetical protein [Clostridioides difficile]|uniref:hypothetical protein n=2 Tax=Clostridioides difficile TaxID=1496 RepID=UPI00355695C8
MSKRKKRSKRILKPLLSKREIKHLMDALDANMIICVGGVQLPRGKSTLVDLLNENGYRAIKDCDVFKIELNKPIQKTPQK